MNRTGSGILSVFINYLRYRIRSGHRKGRGIHAPFAYELVSRTIYNADDLPAPGSAENYHRRLLKLREEIELAELGGGSRVTSRRFRKISSIAKRSSVSRKQGNFLYRLVNWYHPVRILELGTGIGISTAYLASGFENARVASLEGDSRKIKLAEKELQLAGFRNIELINTRFEWSLQEYLDKLETRSIVFVDGDHRYEPTVNAVHGILELKLEQVLIVLDDIYWSKEMEKAWKYLCSDSRIGLSVDIFFMGILVVRPGMHKQHYDVTF